MTVAFVLDASACSGCKACQVACKDKNQLAPGVLWRRVYEVSGGGWTQDGAGWKSSVFAYNLTLSCNHCVHPKCAGVCPADAFSVRANGVVILDSAKCMGCGYCAWACPYGAPQYDAAAGHMTKCDFCIDNIEAGAAPACVAACPMRVLSYAEAEEGLKAAAGQTALWEVPAETHPYPMAASSGTRPRLVIKPHPAMMSAEEKRTANREEVEPAAAADWRETPLVAFSLLMQMAAGVVLGMLWLFPDTGLRWLPVTLAGLCTGGGLLASFAHLGTKRNAWRALNHLRKSWLSREILFSLLFGVGWLATATAMLMGWDAAVLSAVTGLLGLVLIYCMARVYRLRPVEAWDARRTERSFFLSMGLLGILGLVPLLAWSGAGNVPWAGLGAVVMLLLGGEAAIVRSQPPAFGSKKRQAWLLISGAVISASIFLVPGWMGPYTSAALLCIVMAEQVTGRWSFYRARSVR